MIAIGFLILLLGVVLIAIKQEFLGFFLFIVGSTFTILVYVRKSKEEETRDKEDANRKRLAIAEELIRQIEPDYYSLFKKLNPPDEESLINIPAWPILNTNYNLLSLHVWVSEESLCFITPWQTIKDKILAHSSPEKMTPDVIWDQLFFYKKIKMVDCKMKLDT